METDLLPNIRGNVQTLRHMWSLRAREAEQFLQSSLVASQPTNSMQKRISIKEKHFQHTPQTEIIPQNLLIIVPTASEIDEPESDEEMPPPPTPPLNNVEEENSTMFNLTNVFSKVHHQLEEPFIEKNNNNPTTAIHHWHITRHVVRSGLILHRLRRASDSLLPLLKKTHLTRSSTDSVESNPTPFQSLVDYLSHKDTGEKTENLSLLVPNRIKRSASEHVNCIRRNKLDDSIVQYERILRHLKNYEQFMADYSASTRSESSTKFRRQSLDRDLITPIKELSLRNRSRKNSQTQSLSYRMGRTFSEFLINDLLRTPSPKTTVDFATEPVANVEIPPLSEEAVATLNQLDIVLDRQSSFNANSPVNVIVINSPDLTQIQEVFPIEKTLMERLFEGKKSAFDTEDLALKSMRLPNEMIKSYELSKKKFLSATEQVMYIAKIMKISRRAYKEDIRFLSITNEFIYNLSRKNVTTKEALPLENLIGITCTPFKDGFICLHTKNTRDDRGDWLMLVDHPCELISQLFIALRREHNDDNFLKIESKFHHRRRMTNEVNPHECTIETRQADQLYLEKADMNTLIIYTP